MALIIFAFSISLSHSRFSSMALAPHTNDVRQARISVLIVLFLCCLLASASASLAPHRRRSRFRSANALVCRIDLQILYLDTQRLCTPPPLPMPSWTAHFRFSDIAVRVSSLSFQPIVRLFRVSDGSHSRFVTLILHDLHSLFIEREPFFADFR